MPEAGALVVSFLSTPRVLYLGNSSSWDGGLLENVAQDQWGHHIAESMLFCVKEVISLLLGIFFFTEPLFWPSGASI